MVFLMLFYLHVIHKSNESGIIALESLMHEETERRMHDNRLIKPNMGKDE